MAIRAVDKWLDEGWSAWRIGYGATNFAALVVVVVGYAAHRHHPGAVWWVVAALAVVAIWALGEMIRWRIRHSRLQRRLQQAADTVASQGSPASAEPAVSAPVKGAAEVTGGGASPHPFVLTVEQEDWPLFRHAGYICALLIKITNTTSEPITVVRCGIGTDWQRGPGEAPVQISDEDRKALSEEARIRRERKFYGAPLTGQPIVVPPGGCVSGWLVTYVARPWTGGRPRCTITMHDEVGNEYKKVIEQRNPQTYVS